MGIFGKELEEEKKLREFCGEIARQYAEGVRAGDEPTRAFTEMTGSASLRLEIRRLHRYVATVKSERAANKASVGWATSVIAGNPRVPHSYAVADEAADVIRSIVNGSDEDDTS